MKKKREIVSYFPFSVFFWALYRRSNTLFSLLSLPVVLV